MAGQSVRLVPFGIVDWPAEIFDVCCMGYGLAALADYGPIKLLSERVGLIVLLPFK